MRYEAENLVASSLDTELDELLRDMVCFDLGFVDDVVDLDCLRDVVSIVDNLAISSGLNALSIILVENNLTLRRTLLEV